MVSDSEVSDSEISDVSPVDSDVEGQQEKSYDRCVCVCCVEGYVCVCTCVVCVLLCSLYM